MLPMLAAAGISALGGIAGNLIGGNQEKKARMAALRLLEQGKVSGDLQKLYADYAEDPAMQAALQAGLPSLQAQAAGAETPEQQYQRAQDDARIAAEQRGTRQAQEAYSQRTGARTAGQTLALGRMGDIQAGSDARMLGLKRLADRGAGQREAMGLASNLSTSQLGRTGTIKNAQAGALQQRWTEANAMADARRGVGAGQTQRGANLGAAIGSGVGGLMSLIPTGGSPFAKQNQDDPRVDPKTGWVD